MSTEKKKTYIGIDLGTSAMKLLLVDEEGLLKRRPPREGEN